MKLFKEIFISIFIFFFSSNLILAENKIVYLNVDKVMAISKAGKSLKTQLDKIHKLNIKNFKKIEEKLKKDEKTLIAKKNILSQEDFKKEFDKLRNEAQKYQQKRSKSIISTRCYEGLLPRSRVL